MHIILTIFTFCEGLVEQQREKEKEWKKTTTKIATKSKHKWGVVEYTDMDKNMNVQRKRETKKVVTWNIVCSSYRKQLYNLFSSVVLDKRS